MGPSGIGKTTLLRLIGGQIAPDHGEILFDGENIPAMSRSRLYTVRKRMSMLFQSGALFTDMNVFDKRRLSTARTYPTSRAIVA
ncbi:ABC transporter ATP-binding protein [Escherichia coli]|uniref:ABC transporter ATP-binding protein n=1 Tax=Escherichia coli TaxID=562 RepID=A0A376KKB8_ECOLX|nr:ABC transporter ATP-binding protein [Escherichia coli]